MTDKPLEPDEALLKALEDNLAKLETTFAHNTPANIIQRLFGPAQAGTRIPRCWPLKCRMTFWRHI
jgi:hypothetical protein